MVFHESHRRDNFAHAYKMPDTILPRRAFGPVLGEAAPLVPGNIYRVRQYPMINPNALHERGKSGVRVKRLEHRILREEVDQRRSISHGSLQP